MRLNAFSISPYHEDRHAADELVTCPRVPMPRHDYSGVALLISACLHGVMLYGRWGGASATQPEASVLEVVLVNAQTSRVPADPRVIAQQSLDGGGVAHRGIATSALPRTIAQSPDAQVLLALRKRQMQMQAQQQELLTQLLQHPYVLRHPPAQQAPELPDEAAIQQDSQMINARIAALKDHIDQYNARAHHQLAAPAAARAAYAAYVEAWRRRIERLGTEHYPLEARGRIYGSLRLAVTIRRDGSLDRIHIDRPSEHAVLNVAARRIVQLAAPFPPLPDEFARITDTLVITRTWHFTDQQLDTTP